MSKYCIVKDGPALYPECNDCKDKKCEYFYCLVVGSRTFEDYELMKNKLDYFLSNHGKKVVIVSGGAKGADSLAKRYAKDKGFEYVEFPADWENLGKTAGYIRNEQMHKYISKAAKRGVVAFWDGESKGTAHNFTLAKRYSNPIKTVIFSG